MDNDGTVLSGNLFCVGSGGMLANGIMDSVDDIASLPLSEVVEKAKWAIRHAAQRDAYSGGVINVFHINETGIHHLVNVDSQEASFQFYDIYRS